jgi:hypothetical protein
MVGFSFFVPFCGIMTGGFGSYEIVSCGMSSSEMVRYVDGVKI